MHLYEPERIVKSYDKVQLFISNTWYFIVMLLFASRVGHSYTYAISFLFIRHQFVVSNTWIEDQEHSLNNHHRHHLIRLGCGWLGVADGWSSKILEAVS